MISTYIDWVIHMQHSILTKVGPSNQPELFLREPSAYYQVL